MDGREKTTRMFKPQKKQEELVYQNKYSQVYSQEVDFGSFTKEYFYIVFGEKTGVLVVRDNAILLVRQYRLLINRLSWEIPGGKIDKQETAQEAAIRECFEETGIRCRRVTPLMNYHQTLEGVNGFIHLFYTEDFEDEHSFKSNEQEVESIQWVPLGQCLKMIQGGEISDSFSILALLAYKTFMVEKK